MTAYIWLVAPLASTSQLSKKYLWNNERTQEAKDSQEFALSKAIIPPSQGLSGSKHKKHKASLPSTFQFAKPLKVHYVLGNPGLWVDRETELRERTPCEPTLSSAPSRCPRSELELETTSLPTLRVKLRRCGTVAHLPPRSTLATGQTPLLRLERELWIWSKEEASTLCKHGYTKTAPEEHMLRNSSVLITMDYTDWQGAWKPGSALDSHVIWADPTPV